jgi:sulfite exporter TauE/SafE
VLINGLIFGLISTLHCAGMCGPLAFYIPSQVKGDKRVFAVLYQIGRISIYILIGLMVYLLGMSFSFFKLQQVLSIVMGSLMVVYVLWPLLKLPQIKLFSNLQGNILKKISNAIGANNKKSALGLGIMNGLLPCGAIYIAALYCASFSHVSDALIYMSLFGLGTMPVFIAAWMLLSKQFSFKVKRFTYLYRALPLIVGILMILRGANLGIPYLSPELEQTNQTVEVKNCCKH